MHTWTKAVTLEIIDIRNYDIRQYVYKYLKGVLNYFKTLFPTIHLSITNSKAMRLQ